MAPPAAEVDPDAGQEPDATFARDSSPDTDQLEDEITFQKAMLESLLELPSLDDSQIEEAHQIRVEINKLKKRLAHARGEGNPSTDSPANMSFNASFRGQYQPSGYSSSNMSTPGSSNSIWGGDQRPLKRSFASHLDGGENYGPEVKSRRTTPSPAVPSFGPPTQDSFREIADIIDLTGEDEEDFIKRQDEEMSTYKLNKERADRDAELARQLETGGFGGQGRSSPSLYGIGSANGGSFGGAGPSAFDHILRRAQASGSGPSGHNRIKPEGSEEFEEFKPEDVESQPPLSQAPSTLPTYRMPGSFGDDFEQTFGAHPPARDYGQHGNHLAALPSRPSPTTPGFGASATEMARLATMARYSAPSAFGAFSSPISPFQNLPSNPALFTTASHPSVWAQAGQSANRTTLSGGPAFPGPGYTQPQLPRPHLPRPHQPLPPGLKNESLPDIIGNMGRLPPWAPWFMTEENAEEEIKALISNIRPDEDISRHNLEGTPEALRFPLYIHQHLALEWMKKMETGSNKGGSMFLADDMGLGKTISTLALMVARPSESRACRTNLIIGPVALIKQWELEIKEKLKGGQHAMSVFLLHGKKTTYDELRVHDVVLTTYGTVAQEWKRYHKWIADHPDANPLDDVTLAKKHPLVHPKNAWYRVILDEAQCIKNRDTQSSKGAHQITATYRWCLTGTPMMNSVSELYSLFRFLRIKPYQDLKKFNDAFSSLTAKGGRTVGTAGRDKAMQQLRAVLKATMLRRMKSSLIDGKPILNLPPKTEVSTHVVFSPDEHDFYQQMESKAQVQFNKYLRAGTIGKNYSNILVLLLRLRQACCHPHLNLDFETVGVIEGAQDMVALAGELSEAVVTRIKGIEAFECPICYDVAVNPRLVLPCGHDTCSECFQRLIDNSREDNMREGNENAAGAKCPQCRGMVDPTRAIDYHTFVRVHMPEKAAEMGLNEDGAENEQDDEETDSEDETDSEAGEDVDQHGNLRGFVVPDDDVSDVDSDPAPGQAKPAKAGKAKKAKSKGKKKADKVEPHMLKHLRKEANKNADARRKYMRYLRKNWEPSAKVDKACEILEGLKASGEKTIIFSVWTGLLDLLEVPIKHRMKLTYERYDGGMSAAQRDTAARKFMKDPRVTVMLVSLKAGNAGLNLTAASQVIIMDPFWNPYIEMQAVDRAHRIGQQRPVHVHRILVKGTVEDRIIDLQEQKRALVDAALDEGAHKSIGRLDVRQLRYLFGVNS